MIPKFFIRGLWLGPAHVSFVRNVPMFERAQIGRFGWLWAHEPGFYTCGTLRVRSWCLNLDVDWTR